MTKIEVSDNGYRAKCPFCGKDFAMPPSIHEMGTQGIWAHVRTKHKDEPRQGMFEDFRHQVAKAVGLRRKSELDRKEAERVRVESEKREAREAPLRIHSITGAFLIEVREELDAALDMMEPYYKQTNADVAGYRLVSKLDEIIKSSPAKQHVEET